MIRTRIVWNEEERAAVAKAARAMVEGSQVDPLYAYNKVQAEVLPTGRHRMAGAVSQANTEVMAAILGAPRSPHEKASAEKAAADLAAAEALLGEASTANDRLRSAVAERDAQIVDLERRLRAEQEHAAAASARAKSEGDALVDALAGIMRRVMAEVAPPALRPGDCPPARVPNPGTAPVKEEEWNAGGDLSKTVLDMVAEVEAPISRESTPPPETTVAAEVAKLFGGGNGERQKQQRPPAGVVYKPRILIVAGSETPTKYDSRWRAGFPSVDLRIERAHADGNITIPKNYDAAVLVKGVRHATTELVRHVYHGAPLALRNDVPRVLTSILSRIRGH